RSAGPSEGAGAQWSTGVGDHTGHGVRGIGMNGLRPTRNPMRVLRSIWIGREDAVMANTSTRVTSTAPPARAMLVVALVAAACAGPSWPLPKDPCFGRLETLVKGDVVGAPVTHFRRGLAGDEDRREDAGRDAREPPPDTAIDVTDDPPPMPGDAPEELPPDA